MGVQRFWLGVLRDKENWTSNCEKSAFFTNKSIENLMFSILLEDIKHPNLAVWIPGQLFLKNEQGWIPGVLRRSNHPYVS